ncbi:unnamed protein product, partial [Sphacelaria rigidula]
NSEPVQKRPRLLDEAVKEVGATGDVSLKFSDSFATENQSLVLLQVPESLLSEIGEDASRDMVRLIGSEDQDAVLVTEGKTFKLTKAETSNTLLLMPPEGTAVTSVPATACGKGGGEAGGGGFEAVAAVGFQYEVKK